MLQAVSLAHLTYAGWNENIFNFVFKIIILDFLISTIDATLQRSIVKK